MKNIISYSLYTNKKGLPSRVYDPVHNHGDRYWFNIPAILIVNSLCYPDFITKIHFDPLMKNHSIFPMIDFFKDKIENFSYEIVNLPYKYTEPSSWRLKPLWDNDCDIVLCRDIDSVPNTIEIKSTKHFVNNDCLIHNMRTHPHHNTKACWLLAGLCSFKKEVKTYVDTDFLGFYKKTNGNWGSDQNLLVNYFIERLGSDFTKKYFLDDPLDCLQKMCINLEGLEARHPTYEEKANIKIDINNNILLMIDTLTTWPGQPVDSRGFFLKNILEYDYDIIRIVKEGINKEKSIKNHYLKE